MVTTAGAIGLYFLPNRGGEVEVFGTIGMLRVRQPCVENLTYVFFLPVTTTLFREEPTSCMLEIVARDTASALPYLHVHRICQ